MVGLEAKEEEDALNRLAALQSPESVNSELRRSVEVEVPLVDVEQTEEEDEADDERSDESWNDSASLRAARRIFLFVVGAFAVEGAVVVFVVCFKAVSVVFVPDEGEMKYCGAQSCAGGFVGPFTVVHRGLK